jgi:transposase
MRRCPGFKAFAARLAAKGKPKKVIIGAVMRKLMHIVYGVLKHRTPYDPSKVCGPIRAST